MPINKKTGSSAPKRKAARRRSRVGSSTSETGGVPREDVRPRPAPAKAPTPQPVTRRVTIRSRVGQVIFASLINDDGAPEQLRLGPFATSEVSEDRLTEYTRSLVRQGKLTIDPIR